MIKWIFRHFTQQSRAELFGVSGRMATCWELRSCTTASLFRLIRLSSLEEAGSDSDSLPIFKTNFGLLSF
jgi:hypothetical protein